MNNNSVPQPKSKKNVNAIYYYEKLLQQAQCRTEEITQEDLSWFKIKNYDYVKNLKLRELIIEIVVRANLCTRPDVVCWRGTFFSKTPSFSKIYPKIISGEPEIHGYFISHDRIPDMGFLKEEDETFSPEPEQAERNMNVSAADDNSEACFAQSKDAGDPAETELPGEAVNISDADEKANKCSSQNEDERASPELALPVREMSIRDIDVCYDALSYGDKKKKGGTEDNRYYTLEESLHPCHLGVSKSLLDPDTPLTDVQRNPFSRGIEQIYLTVDPSFTESQIIAAFKEILASINTRHGIFTSSEEQQSKLRKKTMYDIHAYHIIPLIDLVLWQIQNRKRFPLRMVYNLLKNKSLNASASTTGYSETNFKNANLKTFDLIMNQGDPGAVLKELIENKDDYELSWYKFTHR